VVVVVRAVVAECRSTVVADCKSTVVAVVSLGGVELGFHIPKI